MTMVEDRVKDLSVTYAMPRKMFKVFYNGMLMWARSGVSLASLDIHCWLPYICQPNRNAVKEERFVRPHAQTGAGNSMRRKMVNIKRLLSRRSRCNSLFCAANDT